MRKKIEIDLVVLSKLYAQYKFSTTRLADLFNVSTKTIQRRLNEAGFDLLKAQNRDEFGRLYSKGRTDLKPMNGSFNGMYKGGISTYRRDAFEEFGFEKVCFHCETTEDIVIHHLDRNRYNNRKSNLRPVCRKCHMNIEHPYILENAREAKRKKREEAN